MSKEFDKIRAAAEKANVKCVPGLHDGEMILKATTIIAMCDRTEESEKERKDYRRMLHLSHAEFEDQYKWNRYALEVCRSLSFRIGKLLCKYDKRPDQKEVMKCFYGRQSIKDLCTEGVPRLELEEANTLLREERRILAMLASDKPEFTNPTAVAAARSLCNKILKTERK